MDAATGMTPEAMLERLVAFPTVSSDSNLELIGFVRDWLAGHGVEARIVPSEDGTKAGLFAQIGPAVPGGVVLSAHTDVVPVEGQPWSTDPFTLAERNGRLHGRGTADMKGFAALVLALVPEMLRAGLKRPVQIALSHDEEVGCLGAPALIAAMREALPPASACIVGEPTLMRCVTRHKGVVGLATRVRGFAVHSSQVHRGVSAVMTAARLIGWAEARMAENRAASEAAADPDAALFEPPYTTLHCGMIRGGTARNITAEDCRFSLDIRTMPAEDPGDWASRWRAAAAAEAACIRAVRPEAGIEVETRSLTPGCRQEEGGEAERLVRALTGDNAGHAVAYGTEAGLFQAAGYSTAICGPGSIDQAHQADEYISRAQMAEGEAMLRGLIARLAA